LSLHARIFTAARRKVAASAADPSAWMERSPVDIARGVADTGS